ncbi:MAG: bifunctional molybdenum cofactor biosynthesis protein MoaC/MoaB, partial [Mycobacterium sp.]|nr:bifunctional molybdenum cofactor biosynthesis protein MoaC/MoaB [Mycobacterium sp.]
MSELPHTDSTDRIRMVDISTKPATVRTATASGRLRTTAAVVALILANDLPKADVLTTARLAGIGGAKKTSDLVPLCHQVALSQVTVDFSPEAAAIVITATAKATGATGVEMEALAAVTTAGLTL